jgi:hypothetical protein
MTANMKMAVLWVLTLCSLADVYHHFRGTCCLHHQGDKTMVNFYQTTQHYNPQDSHFQDNNNLFEGTTTTFT